MSALEAAQIKGLLPHRPPALLLDRVLEVSPGERITGTKAVTLESIWYQDVKGPDFAYPGCLLVESWGQSAAVLLAEEWRPGVGIVDEVPILVSVSGVHFDGTVQPGDVVHHHASIDRLLTDTAIVSGYSTVSGRTVQRVDELILALRARHLLA